MERLGRALGNCTGKYYNQPRNQPTDKRNNVSVNENKFKAWMESS